MRTTRKTTTAPDEETINLSGELIDGKDYEVDLSGEGPGQASEAPEQLEEPAADQAEEPALEPIEITDETWIRDLTFDQIEELTMEQARLIGRAHRPRVALDGSLRAIRHRLRIAKEDPQKICDMCGHVSKVIGTSRAGHCTIRQMRCTGKRACTFQRVSQT